MCGIVGGIAQRDVGEILLEGLRRLEYRGYDSAGMAVINRAQRLQRIRMKGKVEVLANAFFNTPIEGNVGIAHTRWATHGVPSERNAHPHQSGDSIALVHNGIIENHTQMRASLTEAGYRFDSDTDTESVVHWVHQEYAKTRDFLRAVQNTAKQLKGAFALGLIHRDAPDQMIAVRSGSPLVIGLGIGENFIASDILALLPVTRRFIFLEDGDIAKIKRKSVTIYDKRGKEAERKVYVSDAHPDTVTLGKFRHYMQKEIFEQPEVIENTLEGRVSRGKVLWEAFGGRAQQIFSQLEGIQIVACGTSYHAGMVARYWLEDIAQIPCRVEIASEFRYRKVVVSPNTLFVTISQSGETADTLAALRQAKKMGYMAALTICNVPESSLVRESDLVFLTRAGAEIGVASTKAFTSQLVSLLLFAYAVSGKSAKALLDLPQLMVSATQLHQKIEQLATFFMHKQHALFLGRGLQYPIAMEGALKLKEISYIHAEAYPAGELKHGPLALVDNEMPVVVIAPSDQLLEKLKSNIQEVRARGGQLIIFADKEAEVEKIPGVTWIEMPKVDAVLAPIVYTVPLQLLAYYVALIKGTDVDHPRNLAKSVTVE